MSATKDFKAGDKVIIHINPDNEIHRFLDGAKGVVVGVEDSPHRYPVIVLINGAYYPFAEYEVEVYEHSQIPR